MSTPVSHIDNTSVPKRSSFKVGDHVSVAVLIREGSGKDKDKTRIQNFIGDVIAIKGQGAGKAFTVRRVVQGEGVERVFPYGSPLVKEIEILRRGDVRRAKLYDLRTKSGKAARISEKVGGARELADIAAAETKARKAEEKAAAEAVAAEKVAAEAAAAAEAEKVAAGTADE